jgi:hypothetical protein
MIGLRAEGRCHMSDFIVVLTRPRGVARSTRHPVKVEVGGSNPLGDAFSAHICFRSTNRFPAKAAMQWTLLYDFVSLTNLIVNIAILVDAASSAGVCREDTQATQAISASAEHGRAQVAVTHPPHGMQVQLLPDALAEAVGFRP